MDPQIGLSMCSSELKILGLVDSKRIVLSHTQTFEKKEDESSKPKKKKKVKPNIEEESKNTIGDANEQLQELKDKMDGK